MFKKVLILNFLFGALFAQSPVEFYKSAQASLDAGKLSIAEKELNAAIAADPTYAPAYLGLARVSMRKGDLEATNKYLNEALEVEPENKAFREESESMQELFTLMSRGRKSMSSGDADNAFESFRIASEKFPNYPESVFYMGITLFRKKEFTEAVEYLKRTLEINPEHKNASAAINNVAKSYFINGNKTYKRGDLEGALSSYEEVLKVDDTFYQAYYQIGVIQSKMGDKELAISTYEKALNVNPQFYKGYLALGLAKKDMNDMQAAISALESAVEINPGYDKAYGAMGDIYINAKNYDKAKEVLNIAITVNEDYAYGYKILGKVYKEEENWDKAISTLQMAVALNERDATSYYELAVSFNAKGKCEEAKIAARNSTEIKNRFGGAWLELGIAEWCSGRGNKTGALNAFEKARGDRTWRTMAEHEIDKVKNPQKYEN
jgi:tetratricopeptide (TPR) repeat protein